MTMKMPEPQLDEKGHKMFLEYLKSLKIKPNKRLQRFKLLTNTANSNN